MKTVLYDLPTPMQNEDCTLLYVFIGTVYV